MSTADILLAKCVIKLTSKINLLYSKFHIGCYIYIIIIIIIIIIIMIIIIIINNLQGGSARHVNIWFSGRSSVKNKKY